MSLRGTGVAGTATQRKPAAAATVFGGYPLTSK